MTTQAFDPAKAAAFAGRMLDILNGAGLALMTSIGHQTSLFDTMAGLPPSTSHQIAQAAGLNERYVREWLGAMVTGRIVDYDPRNGTYALPPEHAALLTRTAGLRNLATITQFIALLGSVEEGVVESFRKGGGVPESAYSRFQRLTDEASSMAFDVTLVKATLPLIPGLVERLQAGIDVADVGCGCGHAINLMAQAFPNSRFTGYDVSEEGIAAGRAEAVRMGLSNVRFVVKDLAALDISGQYDLITTFFVIHELAQPTRALKEIADALRPDGILLIGDLVVSSNLHENLDHPLGPFLYMGSTMHCVTTSLALNGEGLGMMWGEQKARQMLVEAGFTQVEVKRAPGNSCLIATTG